MKILYYDCFSGISGDMNLGAMVDLGVDSGYLGRELSKLKLDSEYVIRIAKGAKNGITGTKVDVLSTDKAFEKSGNNNHTANTDHLAEHTHEDNHEHQHESFHGQINNHSHEQTHSHSHKQLNINTNESGNNLLDGIVKTPIHHHRYLKDIEKIINDSDLSDRVKKSSMEMFMKIALAEAKVHGKPVDEVHFHEVGAIDSIIDIVGAAIAFDYLKVDKIMSSPVQVGGGFVKCAHGLIPVPVPATVEILKGVPLKFGVVLFETTTPTGAAILAANVEEFTEKLEFSIDKIGYGIGNRDLEIPNVLRAFLGTVDSENANDNNFINNENNQFDIDIKSQIMIETNIDDMNPEIYDYIEEKLFKAGALDVFKTPIIMKKGRPAIKLSILTDPQNEEAILDLVFKETTSIGVRKFEVGKMMLQRSFYTIKTKYGDVTIKNAYYKGELVKHKAEYEDCKRIAKENNVPITRIYKEVDFEMGKLNH